MPPVPATPNLGGVSTRMLIILALVCGAIISRNLNFQNTAE